MLDPHDVKSLMDDSAFAGTTFVSCLGSFQVNAVNPMTWSIVTQGGAAARLLVVYHHPVLVRGGGGAELGAGNLLNIIETKGDCPSFCLIKVHSILTFVRTIFPGVWEVSVMRHGGQASDEIEDDLYQYNII